MRPILISLRFKDALQQHWKRLLIGAALAWLVVNIVLIGLLVALEYNHVTYDDYDLALFSQFVVIASLPAGALIAYARRNRETVSHLLKGEWDAVPSSAFAAGDGERVRVERERGQATADQGVPDSRVHGEAGNGSPESDSGVPSGSPGSSIDEGIAAALDVVARARLEQEAVDAR